MNYRIILCGLSAALALVACQKENGTNGNDGTEGTAVNRYLSVKLAQTPDTRASGDQTTGEPGSATYYEEGDENTISKVRFYFFNSDGTAASVKKYTTSTGTEDYRNWCDAEETTGNTTNMPNVEKELTAVIILNLKEDKQPAKIAVVANYDKASLGDGNLSLDDLTAICDDYSKAGTSTDKDFLMTSSVYADNGEKVLAVDLTDANLQQTEELAKSNPVTLYIERVLAKVRFNLTGELNGVKVTDGIIPALNSEKTAITTSDGKELYIKLIGWDVTATTDKSYLFKSINASWDKDKNWGSTNPWTYPDYHRSYWAINPKEAKVATPTEGSDGGYVSYDDVSQTDFTGGYTYVQENAANNSDGTKTDTETQVIIAARLCTASGTNYTPVTVYQYAGYNYLNGGDCKHVMVNALGLYKQKDDNTYSQLGDDDIALLEFVSASAAGVADYEGTGRYKSVLQLLGNAATPTWYTKSGSEYTKVEDVNETLKGIYCSLYANGASYFYFPIQHLGYGVTGATFGEYGVVRNHIYSLNVEAIFGLGTPVPPDSTDHPIIPEKPSKDVYVAAQINVLSWRVVSNNVELDW